MSFIDNKYTYAYEYHLMCLCECTVVSNSEGQQGLLKKVREAESIGIYSALNKASVSETKRIEDRNILWVNNHKNTQKNILCTSG